jgi:two-component system sensor kinase FixL
VLDATDALLVVTEPDGRIVRFNRACQKLTGLTAAEAIGARRSMPQPYELDGQWLSAVEQLKSGIRQVRYESTWETRAGERRDIAWSSTAILNEEGEVRHYIDAGIDITEMRAAQRKADKLQHDLYRIGRLSELGEMASAIAHELNQPLTAIANYVGAGRRALAAVDDDRAPRISELMGKAVEQTDRAGQIIRRLRQLIGRGQSELLSYDINAVIRDASELALIDAAEHGVTTRLDLAKALPPVLADATQIQQVVFNLLRNSVDAVATSDRREIVVRSLLNDRGEIEVTVSDSGPGLAPEVAEQLFMPFVTTKPNGMGIGLSICRSIIDAHEGRIWATPGGEGTTFGFALPAGLPGHEEEHD